MDLYVEQSTPAKKAPEENAPGCGFTSLRLECAKGEQEG